MMRTQTANNPNAQAPMPKSPKWTRQFRLFESDIQKIEEAVNAAELRTTGEIVMVIARRSTAVGHLSLILYPFLTLAILLTTLADPYIYSGDLLTNAMALAWFVGLYFFCEWLEQKPQIQRWLTSSEIQNRAVWERAELEFYRRGLKQTQGKTGILLFVSLMERQAVVLADEAISAQCPEGTWKEIIEALQEGVRKSNLTHGVVRAIERVGAILAGVLPAATSNPNEIVDTLHFVEGP